jgi:hypothetical protein
LRVDIKIKEWKVEKEEEGGERIGGKSGSESVLF